MMVSVWASDMGWLFADLLRRFEVAGAAVSHEPLTGFDSYLCIRSTEAILSPDLAKTVVQIHTNEPRWVGHPSVLSKCAAFIFTHPAQREMLERLGVDVNKPSMMRPIGASQSFKVREVLPDTFTVGWVGRNSGSFKRLDLFVDIVKSLNASCLKTDAILAGGNLGDAAAELRDCGITVTHFDRSDSQSANVIPYWNLYHRMDALVITSASEAGPLPLFEALASGLIVVSTECGWSSHFGSKIGSPFIEPPQAQDFVNRLAYVYRHREDLLAMRHWSARLVKVWTLEDWIAKCLEFTSEVTA